MKEIKNFQISPSLVRESLVDQSMLFTHFYLMQGENIKPWFVSQASREYFSFESTTFLSANTFKKKYMPTDGKMN